MTDDKNRIDVKYVSFAGYERSLVEFYFNCASKDELKQIKIQPIIQKNETKSSDLEQNINKTLTSNIENKVKEMIYMENLSMIDFGLIVLCSINFSINILQLYCMYLFSKYLDS